MNNNYYPNYQVPNNFQNNEFNPNISNNQINDQSYLENTLKFNKGKVGKFYFSFPYSDKYKDIEFTGILKQIGKDFIIIKDSTSEKCYMIPLMYLSYIQFEENINY